MTIPCATDPSVSSYARLCQPATLKTAWKLVRCGGTAAGPDGRTLEQFAAVAKTELQTIAEQLRRRRYRFSPVRRAFVRKLSGASRRLGIPTVRDRVVEQALRLVLEPALSPGFSVGSFAYRSGRGVHSAMDALLEHRRTGNSWILQSDVQDFFDSINHAILLAALARAKIDPELLGLIAAFLAAGVRLGRRWFPARRGVPQGSPLSPLLANFYLNPFDHAIQQAGYELIRYADDFLVCCQSRPEAFQALDEVVYQLGQLKLAVNQAKTRILNSWHEPFEFLGFLVTPKGLRPSDANIHRFQQAITDLTSPNSTLPLADLIGRINPLIRSFRSFYQRCHVVELLAQLDAWIATRLHLHLKRAARKQLPAELLPTRYGLERLAAARPQTTKSKLPCRPARDAWAYGRCPPPLVRRPGRG